MELKDIKVGDLVICGKKHDDDGTLTWVWEMDNTVGKPMLVTGTTASGNVKCKAGFNPSWWAYKPEWLEFYGAFRVGDAVVCKENHRGNSLWVKDMDDTVGKKLAVVKFEDESGRLFCKCENGCAFWFEPEWLEAYEEKGNGKVKKTKKATEENAVVDEAMVYGIREIISNPAKRATTVHFNDGKIICVKAGVDVERPDIYSAVTAAIGIHFAGSNNALKNIISRKTTELKPKRKGPRKEFTIEAGDLVKLTKRGKKDAIYPAVTRDGTESPYYKVRFGEEADRELLVTTVDKIDDKTIAYVNVPEKVKDFEYKIPVELLRITRKGE